MDQNWLQLKNKNPNTLFINMLELNLVTSTGFKPVTFKK